MAGSFAGFGAVNYISLGAQASWTQRTYSAWFYADEYDAGASFPNLWAWQASDGSVLDAFAFNPGSSNAGFNVHWSGGTAQWTIPLPSTAAWHHLVVVYDGGSTANDPLIWLDGVAQTVTETIAPSGTLTSASKVRVLGNNHTGSLNRQFDGRIAEFAGWDGLATEAQVLAWSKGCAPPLHTSGLTRKFYVPLWISGTERERWSGLSVTVSGATKGDHPPGIVYPHRRGEHAADAADAPPSPPVRYRIPAGLAADFDADENILHVWDGSLAIPRLVRAPVLAPSSGTPTLPDLPAGFAGTASWIQVSGDDGEQRVVPAWATA